MRINVQENMIIPTSQPQPIVGEGDLSYNMEVTVGQLVPCHTLFRSSWFCCWRTSRCMFLLVTSCYDQSEREDECSAGTDNCSDNATCYDTDRSFLCTCNDGYSGDGIICDNMWSSVTYKSYDLICSVGGRNFRSWEKTHSKHRSTGAYNISVFRTHFFISSLDKRSSRKTSKSF